MRYVLGNMENEVKWYRVDPALDGGFVLLPVLDLKRVTKFADKEAAKEAALSIGLKAWRYVRL